MRLEDDEDGQETEPMLSPSGRSPVHGTIEIDDAPVRFQNSSQNRQNRPKTSNSSVVRWAKQRFSTIYLVLAILILIALAVLVVAIFLAIRVKRMDDKYHDVAENGKNEFRKLYEQVAMFRNGRHGTFRDQDVQSVVQQLTPEQLAQAKAAGLIPNIPNELSPGIAGLEPIKPVDTFSPQADDPSTTIPSASESGTHWSMKDCNAQCQKSDMASPPLVVLSLDGFAREYLDRNLVPSLNKLTNCGARAEFMYPSYPSKTFPNHYTIATGLYPESHGIVDNGAYDPSISPKFEDFKKTKFAKFYGGEPIWSQAVRHGKKMYCLFWPGCSFNITGHNPTWDLPYNKSLLYSDRVNMIIKWLHLPKDERPELIMAYFDQPDYVGHFHVNDEQVNLELRYIDTILDFLFTRLQEEKLIDCINIVLLSDHGMKFLNKRVYLNETIDTSGMVVANGVVGRIHMANSTKSKPEIISKLICPKDKAFRVFERNETPKRFHYSKIPRIGDIILDGRPGTSFYESEAEDYKVTSDHGYDFIDPEMHAIFFAHGPNIKPGARLPSFQNIELFNLFVDLLRLPHEVPNNGTIGLLKPLLNNFNPIYPPKSMFLHVLAPCLQVVPFQKREVKSCINSTICNSKVEVANELLEKCHFVASPNNFFHTEQMEYCTIDLCGFSIVTTAAKKDEKRAIATYESLTDSEAEVILNNRNESKFDGCYSVDARFDTCSNVKKEEERDGLKLASILSSSLSELNDLGRVQFLFKEGFVRGPFAYLQNITHQYAKKYSRLVVISGTIYDEDFDGLVDPITPSDSPQQPTHIYRILMRCENNKWNLDGLRCENELDTRVLSFIIKNKEENNCLDPMEYLLLNTARVKDIELLTGIHFFEEPLWYSEVNSLRIRTNISQELWQL